MWESGEELSLPLPLFLSARDVTLDQHDKNSHLSFVKMEHVSSQQLGAVGFQNLGANLELGGFYNDLGITYSLWKRLHGL